MMNYNEAVVGGRAFDALYSNSPITGHYWDEAYARRAYDNRYRYVRESIRENRFPKGICEVA